MDPIFPCCGEKEENMEHLFLRCNVVRRVWFGSQLGVRINQPNMSSNLWLSKWLRKIDDVAAQQVFGLLWSIRRNRND